MIPRNSLFLLIALIILIKKAQLLYYKVPFWRVTSLSLKFSPFILIALNILNQEMLDIIWPGSLKGKEAEKLA